MLVTSQAAFDVVSLFHSFGWWRSIVEYGFVIHNFLKNARVRITGVTSKPELNGRTGVVVGAAVGTSGDERIIVRLDDDGVVDADG